MTIIVVVRRQRGGGSRVSVVNVVTGLRAGRVGVRNPAGARDLCLLQKRPDRLCSPPSIPLIEYRGNKADHSPQRSVDVRHEWNCTFTSLVRLHRVDADTLGTV